jgi:hypothetical protein
VTAGDRKRHSGAMRSVAPGIRGFPDVQLHVRGLVEIW